MGRWSPSFVLLFRPLLCCHRLGGLPYQARPSQVPQLTCYWQLGNLTRLGRASTQQGVSYAVLCCYTLLPRVGGVLLILLLPGVLLLPVQVTSI